MGGNAVGARHPFGRGQSGVSLIEVLVVVAVLVPVVLAATLGLLTSVKVSSSTKVSQSLNAASASFGESLKEIPYKGCAVEADYEGDAGLWTPPPGSSISADITGVEYWDQVQADYTGTCSGDQGSQRISIRMADDEGDADLTIVKRNPAGYPVPPGP